MRRKRRDRRKRRKKMKREIAEVLGEEWSGGESIRTSMMS